jgi:hypothetical protein
MSTLDETNLNPGGDSSGEDCMSPAGLAPGQDSSCEEIDELPHVGPEETVFEDISSVASDATAATQELTGGCEGEGWTCY